MNKDGIISKNDLNELNGINISSDGFSNIQFYYRDEYRGQLAQEGGNLKLEPGENAILFVGIEGKITKLRGSLSFLDVSDIDWGNNRPPATFG